MPPSAFTSPAVTAASRCSASVRRTRFAASLRPGGRPSGFLSDSLPPTFCFFFRASSFSYTARTRQIRLIQAKKRPKAPGRPRRGLGHGLGVRSAQPPSRPVVPCRRVPARACPPEGRLRCAHQGKEGAENLCKAMHSLQMCIRKISGFIEMWGLTRSSLL